MRIKKHLFSVIFILFAFLNIHAQTVQVSETPKPPDIQNQEPNSKKPSNTGSKEVTGDGSEKYRFFIGTSHEEQFGGYSEKEKDEINGSARSAIFIKGLDQLGQQGWRVVSVEPYYGVAILRPDEGQYEYESFETASSLFFIKSGLEQKIKEMSQAGFRLIEHSQNAPWCDTDNDSIRKCDYDDLFIFEKEKDSRKPVNQIIVSSFPEWHGRPSVEMATDFDKKLVEGFYPVLAISRFELLLEKAKDKNEILEDKPEIKIVRSGGVGDLEKKVNDLGRQGYRISQVDNRIVVMYRNSATSGKPVSYAWLKFDKKFEQGLTSLQQGGARYRSAYPDRNGIKNSLIFEQQSGGEGNRAEFKILEFELESRQAGEKIDTELTPLSKEAVQTMNRLANEGFVVRDLFDADEVKRVSKTISRRKLDVILERIK